MSDRSLWRSRTRRLAVVVALWLTACGSPSTTTFTSTWKPSGAQPVSPDGMRVATLFINNNPRTRRAGEDALAHEISKTGALGLTAYSILSEDLRDRERARTMLRDAGINAVVIMRVVSRDTETSYTPGYWIASPMHGSLWGYWDYGWGSVYDPGYLHTEEKVGVETLLYSVDQDKLLWAGMSDTFNPSSVDSAVRQVAKKAIKQMDEDDVLDR